MWAKKRKKEIRRKKREREEEEIEKNEISLEGKRNIGEACRKEFPHRFLFACCSMLLHITRARARERVRICVWERRDKCRINGIRTLVRARARNYVCACV